MAWRLPQASAILVTESVVSAVRIASCAVTVYQSKRARATKTGLGLGLYITKGLVEAHGGRIDVASACGQRSTFTVWLPTEGTAAA